MDQLMQDHLVDHKATLEVLESAREIANRLRPPEETEAAFARPAERRPDPQAGGEEAGPEAGTIFFTEGEELVKQGPRRSGEGTYRQRASREAVEEILSRINTIRQEKPEFGAVDVHRHLQRPQYWTYLVIGALEQAALIASPRRGTYRFEAPERSLSTSTLWKALQEQKPSKGGDR